ncbi:MAG: hypothetical protein WD648_06045 [Planctomycetaceae bacterium]
MRCAVVLVLAALMPAWAPAQEPPAVPPAPAAEEPGNAAVDQPPMPDAAYDTVWYEYPQWLPAAVEGGVHDAIVRFGWWGVAHSGDTNKVGEWQGLDSSPFYDVDGIFSDGTHTVDFFGSGLDQDTNAARLKFFGPKGSVKVEYDRFMHRLDHDPLQGTPQSGPITPADNVITDDLNVGQDYAIRVQELKASAKGQLFDNVEWRLNVWGMKKTGERQANATAHCFDLDPAAGSQQNKCHVLSQRQRIDWLTMEIEPVITAHFDDLTVEYARTMRQFSQDDQIVDRTYTRFGFSPASGVPGDPFPYAVVPESMTQIDRLKLSTKLTEDNEIYAYMYNGDTENEYRDTRRTFNGVDGRLTNTSIENVTVTWYAKMAKEGNELPPTLVEQETLATLRHPIDYDRSRFGVNTRWRPFYDSCASSGEFDPWRRLALTSGYEYYYLGRDFASYSSEPLGEFTQPDTKRHQISAGVAMPCSPTVDTYVRYKGRFSEDPLIGVRESNGRFNTNQPEQEHGVDLGATWNPASNFMTSVQFSIVNSWNHSEYQSGAPSNQPIDFIEQDYPVVYTVWYAPTNDLSFSGGYAYYSNWIDQDMTTGFRQSPIETSRWEYEGKAHVVNFQTTYSWTPRVKLTGGCDWTSGSNAFTVPPSTTGADWSQLASFSDVIVRTMRYNAGFDYLWRDDVTLYFRYNFFDYEDKSEDFDSGTAHFFLAGASAIY